MIGVRRSALDAGVVVSVHAIGTALAIGVALDLLLVGGGGLKVAVRALLGREAEWRGLLVASLEVVLLVLGPVIETLPIECTQKGRRQ